MRTGILLFLFTFVFSSFTFVGKRKANRVVVPFELIDNLPVVEAMVNGRKGKFIFDTGAPGLVLNGRHFEGKRPNYEIRARGFDGKFMDVKVFQMKYFDMQGLRHFQEEVNLIDLGHIEQSKDIELLGLIGHKIYRYHEVEIDYNKMEIVIYRLNRKGQRKDGSKIDGSALTLDFDYKRHLPCVKGKVGEQELLIGLDSGSEANLVQKTTKEKLGTKFWEGETAYARGVANKRTKMKRGTISQIDFENIQVKNLDVLTSEMAFMDRIYRSKIDLVLGFDFLKRVKVSINYRSKKISFWPIKESKIVQETNTIWPSENTVTEPQ